jgi:hypothetical protein
MPRLPAGNGKSSVTTSRNSIRPVREICRMPSGARKADRDERVRNIIPDGTGCVRRGVRRGLPRSSGVGSGSGRCEGIRLPDLSPACRRLPTE